MEAAFSEMPLALFTTFAPMGAGAFIALAVAFFTTKFDEAELKKIDKMTLIAFAFVVVGFIASLFHLTNPMNGFGIFSGLGTSPLSNEVVVGIVFVIVALVYCVLAVLGKLGEGARKGFAAVVAVLALVLCIFTGMAYMMETIASWNTILVPVQIVGFGFIGGAALASLIFSLSGAAEKLTAGTIKTALVVVAAVGVVAGVGGIAGMAGSVSGMSNAMFAGSDLVSAALPFIIVAAIALIVACVLVVLVTRGKNATVMSVIAVVCAFAGILCARFAFYAMELSVGLYI